MHRFMTLSLPTLFVIMLFTGVALAQERIRELDESHRDYSYLNPPITITERRLGAVPFAADNKLKAGNDWIKDLVLTVKNTSDKTITFISLDLVVRNDGKSPAQFRMPAEFGRPEPVLGSDGAPTGEYVRPVLMPGESGRIKANSDYYLNLVKRLQIAGIHDVESLGIDINYIRFEGNILWSKGAYMRPDPDDPKRYIPDSRKRPELQ